MLELLPPLNDHNLPWMDTIHPIVVHFVIAMVLIAFVFDLIGVVWRRPALFEASFWNLLFATGAIFLAIIFGQVEAGLAAPYGGARTILDIHTTIGLSLAGVLSLLTGWRYVLRSRDPEALPASFLGAGVLVSVLIVVQVALGDRLIWTYGLHTVKVVAAMREGLNGVGAVMLLAIITAMTVWRGSQRFIWRRDMGRQVQWLFLLAMF